MRVGVDATPLLGSLSGVGWYTTELVSALAAGSPGDQFLLLPVTWRRRSLPSGATTYGRNVRVVRRVPLPLWSVWQRVPFPPLEWLVRCDVFHGTNFLAPPSRRTPVVVTVHDLSFVRMPETCHPTIRRYAASLPTVLRRASAVIAVSEFTRDEIAEWMPAVADKTRVVYPAPHRRPAAPWPAGVPEGAPYVLFIGDLAPRKNLPLLVEAFRLLRARRLDVRLVLAGQPTPLLDVPGLVDGLDDVVVTGYVADGRAQSLLHGASVFAFPSTYEGFGMPLLEAMGAGVPVVACDAGPAREVAGDAAILTPDDARAFADAIERALTDNSTRERLVTAGAVRAAEFSWDRAARETLDVYRSVAGA